MGKTNIGWVGPDGYTGNPWIGCTKVSAGCAHCYAAELDENRFSRTMGGGTPENPISHWGKGAPRVRTKAFWKDALSWDRKALRAQTEYDNRHDGTMRAMFKPHTLPPRPDRPRIFPSLCDWLDDEVPIEWLADFLKLIHDTPNLDWLLLTKRPENWKERLLLANRDEYTEASEWLSGSIPTNVWIGVSVEDQKRADERIPLLLHIPANVRFLSVEPLLEKVDLSSACRTFLPPTDGDDFHYQVNGKIDWAIIGGESGKDRRDCGVDAIVDVANQCVAAGVPCFVKQDSAHKPGQQGRIPHAIWHLKNFPCPN